MTALSIAAKISVVAREQRDGPPEVPASSGATPESDGDLTLDTPSQEGAQGRAIRDGLSGAFTLPPSGDSKSAGGTSLPADPVILPGHVLNGRYRIDRLLGRGGMGRVYRVDDQLFPGRPTALKIFRHTPTNAVDLFRTEFKTMASLRHPNVARVYDFEMAAGADAFFFTMELLPGAPLDRFLIAAASGDIPAPRPIEAPQALPWEETLDLLVPVIRALAYLHGRGVVHFDLKPGNIMVSPRGASRQVKVRDFGLAGLRGGGQVIGTPQYLSPEIARAKEGDHRSDLYSLGIMAFRLLTGEFIRAFPRRILNIHPSLLPAFPGLDAQHQALTQLLAQARASRSCGTSTSGTTTSGTSRPSQTMTRSCSTGTRRRSWGQGPPCAA